MRGKFVWAEGHLRTGEGMENTKNRPLHHIHLIQSLVDDGTLQSMPKNYLAGTYSIDPFYPNKIKGEVVGESGNHPPLDEILDRIMAEREFKEAKYDYAATLEHLAEIIDEDETPESYALKVIKQTGGGTFTSSLEPLYYPEGYYVSSEGKEQTYPLATVTPQIIADYVKANITPNEYFGAGVDGGLVYLDASNYFTDRDQAIEFGRNNNQRAIWDAGANAEIGLDTERTSDVVEIPAKWRGVENGVDDQSLDPLVSKTLLPPKGAGTENGISEGQKFALSNYNFVEVYPSMGNGMKYLYDDETKTLYYGFLWEMDDSPTHATAIVKLFSDEAINGHVADQMAERFAGGLEVPEDDVYFDTHQGLYIIDGGTKYAIYNNHGNLEVQERALEAVEAFLDSNRTEVLSATSEDTEPVGKNVGFIQDPHDELYPCLFRGGDTIPSDNIEKLKNHVLEPLSERFAEPDSWISFSIYGSGISYNGDESGDMDIQMWVNVDDFLRYNDEEMDQDELLAEVRKIVQQVNFPSFKEIGITTDGCEGNMLIQYYPKPGTGSKEENLASKPYACFDLDKAVGLQKPIVVKPKFYGETFLLLMPKAEEIAKQAEALLADYKRDLLNGEFWDLLYRKHKNKEFKAQLDQTIEDAEQRKDGIINMFEGIFGGRAEAYSPKGKGIKDERDIMQKLLEVWGIFQDLKHYAREPVPWKIEIPEPKESMAERTGDPELDALIEKFMEEEREYIMCHRDPDMAAGNCANVTEFFNYGLKDNGITGISAQEGYDTLEHGGQKIFPQEGDWFPPQWHGISDTEDDGHDATVVQKDGQTYLIDWTAAQYGETEFPSVKRLKTPASQEIGEDHGEEFTDWNPPEGERKWTNLVRLTGWRIYAADVYELAQKAGKNLFMQQITPGLKKGEELKNDPENDKLVKRREYVFREFFQLMNTILKDYPQLYKMFPGLGREYKGSANNPRLSIQANQYNHIIDIMTQAEDIWKKMRDDPRPDVKVPNLMADFKPDEEMDGFRKLETGVYNGRAENMPQGSSKGGEVVYDFGNGGTIRQLTTPEDLNGEGDQMGHCVGGYCNVVYRGETNIYSLRDDKGMPHVTMEILSQSGIPPLTAPHDKENQVSQQVGAGEIVQIQGKGNQQPKEEYKEMIKAGFKALQSNGVELTYDSDFEVYNPVTLSSFVAKLEQGFDEDEYGIKVDKPYFNDDLVEQVVNQLGSRWLNGGGNQFSPEDLLSDLMKFGQFIEPKMDTESRARFINETMEYQQKLFEEQDALIDQNSDYIYGGLVEQWGYYHPDEQFPSEYGDNPEIQKGETQIIDDLIHESPVTQQLYVVNEFLSFANKDKTAGGNRISDAAAEYQQILDQYSGQPLKNYPGPVNVPGIGPLNFGAHSELQQLADSYMQQKGLGNRPDEYVAVNPDLAAQIAGDYEHMEDNPDDPNVQASYDAFIRETMEQYNMLVNAGYTFEFYPEGQNPYPNSPREAILDLYKNKHMYVYPTEVGYGPLNQTTTNHALLQDSGITGNGKPVTYNDIFRAVHDVFGHAKEGVGFRGDGEENAGRQHFYMYSPLAQPAMTAETRGQNSGVNFGPYGELVNQRAKQDETIYADQKMGILPEGALDTYAKTSAKTAFGSDVVDKATRYLNEGRVELLNNMPDHSIANVRGDTGTWQTEIWRQDPARPLTLSGGSCTCPWGEHSGGRTRIWKKYEGRPCAHVVVLSGESQRQPGDVDEEGNEQQRLFNPTAIENRPMVQPTSPTQQQLPPTNLQTVDQLVIPGTFSKKAAQIERILPDKAPFGHPEDRPYGYDSMHDVLYLAEGGHHPDIADELIDVYGISLERIQNDFGFGGIDTDAKEISVLSGNMVNNNARNRDPIQVAEILFGLYRQVVGEEAKDAWILDNIYDNSRFSTGKRSYTEELEKGVYIRGKGYDLGEDPEFSRSMQSEIYGDLSGDEGEAGDAEKVFENSLRGHMNALADLLGKDFTWQNAKPQDYKLVQSLPMASGMYNRYENTFSGNFINGVTPEEVNEAIWDGEAQYTDYDLRQTFAKIAAIRVEEPGWDWNRVSAFANGGFVRNKVKVTGQDDRGESYVVPRNTVGEVLYSDDNTTIVIFNLKSGPLGAHLIRVEETTDKFMAAPQNILDRGPAPRRRQGGNGIDEPKYEMAFVGIGAPINKLLGEPDVQEHDELLGLAERNGMDGRVFARYPIIPGHIGSYRGNGVYITFSDLFELGHGYKSEDPELIKALQHDFKGIKKGEGDDPSGFGGQNADYSRPDIVAP